MPCSQVCYNGGLACSKGGAYLSESARAHMCVLSMAANALQLTVLPIQHTCVQHGLHM